MTGGTASFVPFLASSAPRNFPLELALRDVSLDGAPLRIQPEAEARFEGTLVEPITKGPDGQPLPVPHDAPVEGALAPDPAGRSKVEPLREIPGMRKASW